MQASGVLKDVQVEALLGYYLNILSNNPAPSG